MSVFPDKFSCRMDRMVLSSVMQLNFGFKKTEFLIDRPTDCGVLQLTLAVVCTVLRRPSIACNQ